MAFVRIEPPPGFDGRGSEYEASGRWRYGNLVRWRQKLLAPWLGWRRRAQESPVAGAPRALMPYVDATMVRWVAVGTHSHLYAINQAGSVFDLTPDGFTAGRADASVQYGFGTGPFGEETFGTPRPDTGARLEASAWMLRSWLGRLVGCMAADGGLHEWDQDTGHRAAIIPGAPTGCLGLHVTQDRFLEALGASGDPRKIAWSDREDETLWTPSATNEAGDIELNTNGAIMCACELPANQTLYLTDLDAHVGTYIGPPLVKGFAQAGVGCGAVSRNCLVTLGPMAVWWGQSGFFLYSGSVQHLECEVWADIAADLNTAQQTKISGGHNPKNGEVIWLYPSADSIENDRYVVWNYQESYWYTGQLARLAVAESGVFSFQLMTGPDGHVYEHDVGADWDGAIPYAQSAPFEIGQGDRTMLVRAYIPDERQTGDTRISLAGRLYPGAEETVAGPYDAANPTDVLLNARQVALKVEFLSAAGHFGAGRLDVRPKGRR
jgi:hypothetical protein